MVSLWNADCIAVRRNNETGSCDYHVALHQPQVFREIQENGIQVFVPELFEDDDASNAAIKEIRNTIPFAVVGSNTLLEVNGKKIRGRVYPWGVVEGTSTSGVHWGCGGASGVRWGCSCDVVGVWWS